MNQLGTYAQNEVAGMAEVEIEISALVKASSLLNQIKENWEEKHKELSTALEKNRRLWTFLASAMKDEGCQQPVAVRQNILNLANYIFKRTNEVLLHPAPEKLEILITINMQIANGLSGKE